MIIWNLFYTVFILQCVFIDIYCQVNNKKFFRKDYVAIDRTDGFYKIHPERRTWHSAKEICEAEGASLFYPNDENEAKILIQHWKRHMLEIGRIFIGISTPFSRDIFETVDGKLLGDVYDKWRSSQPDDYNGADECVALDDDGLLNDFSYASKLPFICKKTLTSLEWNTVCDIPDRAYDYAADFGRCYKLHLIPKKWSDAYAVCRMEQSYLAIANSDAEAKYLSQLMNNAASYNEIEYSGAVHVGFKKTDSWKTIQGLPLYASGYKNWANGQPNGGENNICGSMSNTTQLNDVNCDEKALFICEHEIALLKYSFGLRFGTSE